MLIKHLFGVLGRIVVMGRGGAAQDSPVLVSELPADVPTAFAEEAERGRQAWADDATLGRLVEAPWGAMPGGLVLAAYVGELLTHGWDLAVATGQDPESDPTIVEPALAGARRAIPAEPHGGFVPFGPVVEPAPGAGPTERLANWMGRSRPLA